MTGKKALQLLLLFCCMASLHLVFDSLVAKQTLAIIIDFQVCIMHARTVYEIDSC